MEKDPKKRMTIAQVLQHPWLEDAKLFHQVELFSDQEKQYIETEFTYNQTKRGNRNLESHGLMPPVGSETLGKDMFTEHCLDSVNNSIMKNSETKSVILAPFNSTKSNLD